MPQLQEESDSSGDESGEDSLADDDDEDSDGLLPEADAPIDTEPKARTVQTSMASFVRKIKPPGRPRKQADRGGRKPPPPVSAKTTEELRVEAKAAVASRLRKQKKVVRRRTYINVPPSTCQTHHVLVADGSSAHTR